MPAVLSPGDAEVLDEELHGWKISVRKRKEKDVFRHLKEPDANYTVRRQEMHMHLVMEKSRKVKEVRMLNTWQVGVGHLHRS